MGLEEHTLHILFFPLMAAGHMLPLVDIAKLFSTRGVKTTIFTTNGNVPFIQPTIDRANDSGHPPIQLLSIPFPSAAAGLPEGCENLSSLPSQDLEPNFVAAVAMLRQPFDQVLNDLLPDWIVTDIFLPWTIDVAAKHGIPRLVFRGTSFFSLSASHSFFRHNLIEILSSEVESFVLPGLPHRIEMLKTQVQDFRKNPQPIVELFRQIKESEEKSYGEVVNSFYELEPDYVEHFRKVVGRKAWHIGPVSLCNTEIADKSWRGKQQSSVSHDTLLDWLNSKNPGSVVYICFGSLCRFSSAQLSEMALGFEASNHPFIWVVSRDSEGWMPEGYEERVEGRGLIMRGWAPQILILNHQSVGGFVTHCGWNSILEGISTGLPFVSWPLFAEQFYNERLIVDVLKVGVAVGVKEYAVKQMEREVVEADKIERAVNRLMDDNEEAEERRRRTRELREMASRAVEEGGSSYIDMSNLIRELMEMKHTIERKPIDVCNEKSPPTSNF